MNILLCSVGRRGELVKDFKKTLDENSKIIATDCNKTAPALYFADNFYIVPKIFEPNYIETILEICKYEDINVITTFIDPEIEILAMNSDKFKSIGVEVLAPDFKTALLCIDKFEMYNYLSKNNIKTILTFENIESFKIGYLNGKINFPVFVKPRKGSGSVGARKVNNIQDLNEICNKEDDLIIQEFMDCVDLDVDVYVDTISKKAVQIFSKRKLETKIGGANKTISFKDDNLFSLVKEIVQLFGFNGPIDIDFFYKEGIYYLSEINPRFGGAYLHAHECGVNFISCIENNINGIENIYEFGKYREGVIMMMYDSVVFIEENEM